jgi:hypothetical protein
MDDPVIERLSRFLDDDLDPVDAGEVEQSVASDGELRRELESLVRVRSSLRALADREQPPQRLDALVEPLLVGRPDTAIGRPWARRLAAAAVVILGLAVVFEVQRRHEGPAETNWQERAMKRAAAEPTERFTLAPLPTAPAPDEQRPVGAADRLLSAPDPEIEPVLEPAPALEVLGPLDQGDAFATKSGERGGSGPVSSNIPDGREAAAVGNEKSRAADQPSAPLADTAAAESKQLRSATTAGRARSSSSEAGVVTAQLFVFMAADTAWRSFEPDGPCEAGRYSLRVKIEGGVVRAVWPVANPPAPARQVRASQLVLGLEIDNVADGEYAAEVVVEPRRSPDR